MSEVKQNRRTPSETLFLHLLFHVGFSKALLSETQLREGLQTFSKKAVERAKDLIDGRLAHQMYKWPIRPSNKIPGKSVSNYHQLEEMSYLASSMYFMYEERIYEELTIGEVIQAYDIYTNIRPGRSEANREVDQISPDTAFWLAREFRSQCAIVPYCPDCKVYYYSSVEQKIRNACPFCKEPGIGDYDVSHPHSIACA